MLIHQYWVCKKTVSFDGLPIIDQFIAVIFSDIANFQFSIIEVNSVFLLGYHHALAFATIVKVQSQWLGFGVILIFAKNWCQPVIGTFPQN
jgi:hypothetical protein